MLNREYTKPLPGEPYYRSTGVIKAMDCDNAAYTVGEISYERFDDQNFQYVIVPYRDLMENVDCFQGIPGIDLDLQQEKYYRVNLTPAFIEMRTPSPSREDLWEYLEAAGMDYYDRFEWLLRTEMRCGDDNLVVYRKREPVTVRLEEADPDRLQPGDRVILESLENMEPGRDAANRRLFRLLSSGAEIYLADKGRLLGRGEISGMRFLLEKQLRCAAYDRKIRQLEGVQKAKEEKKYKGRKKNPVDPLLLRAAAEGFWQGKLSEQKAMEKAGIMSRATFYRRLREVDKNSEIPL